MILLIDNYDSFSYNLYQMVGEIKPNVCVIRNDEKSIEEIRAMKPERIIISPGPGRPENAGVIIKTVRELKGKVPILGVCLGHQAVCEALGGTITYAKKLMHGKQSVAKIDVSCPIFEGLLEQEKVGRYHSLAVDEQTLPNDLSIVAYSKEDGEIMAVSHKEYPLYGIQFHPESILTPSGRRILQNFIKE